MSKRCRWATRQSCPVVRRKAATAPSLGLLVIEEGLTLLQPFATCKRCNVDLLLLLMMIPEDQQSYNRSMSLCTLKKSKVNRVLETRSCWESPRHARI
ncbi:hypothetical protein AVEN_246403-1 [Araneus ventricosus]|uniref:Uncharacterized protein n=1 Tax=Araneus ventricosus TaxID=182803 RepID=A0A4Y2HM68_ARAVE|nr:hypothetical protein AVEN_246403-1 [Araneus ventricosus]